MNRVSKPPEIRKQEILDEAKKQFLENGYEKTSMTDIASAINVTEGLCYRYFKSKQELFQKVIDQYVEDCYRQFVPVVSDSSMSIEERLNSNFQILKKIETPNGMNHYFHDKKNQTMHFQIIFRIVNKLLEAFEKVLVKEKGKETIHIDNPADMARFIMFGSLGVLLGDSTDYEKKQRITNYIFKVLDYCPNEGKK